MKIFNADEVTVSFAGLTLQGFGDGEFVRIENDTEAFTDVIGTDGEVTRSKTNDNRSTVTVILMQTSASNDALSAILERDKSTAGGSGVAALYVRDRQGRALYRSAESWIQKAPDVSLDRSATSREWPIRCANLVRIDGGN
jgi:hypothetical protein